MYMGVRGKWEWLMHMRRNLENTDNGYVGFLLASFYFRWLGWLCGLGLGFPYVRTLLH